MAGEGNIVDAAPSYARSSLIHAAEQLAQRGLDNSAAWALDLVECLPARDPLDTPVNESKEGFFADGPYGYGSHRHASSSSASPSSSSWIRRPAGADYATPARQTAYPMQSTPFLGIVAPSSSPAVPTPQRPSKPSPGLESGLKIGPSGSASDEQSSGRSSASVDHSLSGRFPPPFRQPPSPLVNLSYSAEGGGGGGGGGEGQPPISSSGSANGSLAGSARGSGMRRSDKGKASSSKLIEGMEDNDDDSMQEDQTNSRRSAGSGKSGSEDEDEDVDDRSHRSAHVRFASEGAGSASQSRAHSRARDGDTHENRRAAVETQDRSSCELALSCLRTGNLDRCRWVLERSKDRNGGSESTRATFLRLYAGLLICERDEGRDQDPELLTPAPKAQPSLQSSLPSSSSSSRSGLIALLPDLVDPKDPFLLFLKGIIFRKLKKRIEALDCLIRSLIAFPYNWTAWLEFNAVVDAKEVPHVLPLLPQSFMTVFWSEFAERQSAAIKDPQVNIERIEALLEIFPDNAGLWNALGATRYMQQDLISAVEAFEHAMSLDPFRAEGLADYSNALFLLERNDILASLAHDVSRWGSTHPEACCAIGNHFYFQGDHVRAIEAFKRAVKLDPGCVAAWTLLGHAFLEVKNAGAASEMYRRAIEMNPHDNRPWHGLGKVYELLEAWSFSLHYYLKAATIAPYTATVWDSLASVYIKLGPRRYRDAISAYQRQLSCVSGNDVGMQLSRIKAILALLEELYDEGGEGEQRQAEEDMAAWHRRAVAVLIADAAQNAPEAGEDDEDDEDGVENEDGDMSRNYTRRRSKVAAVASSDMEEWAVSFLEAAKSVAGIPYSVELPGQANDEGEDGDFDDDDDDDDDDDNHQQYGQLPDSRGRPPPPPGGWPALPGNLEQARDYVERILAWTEAEGVVGPGRGTRKAARYLKRWIDAVAQGR